VHQIGVKELKFMKKIATLLLFTCCTLQIIQAQSAPKREMRGAWIATYANIDWPSSGATTAQEQSSFIQRLDEHKTTGMNAIFAQVRSQCDALYPNPYDPWSAVISGTQGVAPNPYYDPLQFMITETKQRGMEFHAWFNPYRALASFTTTSYNALAANHVAKLNPTWVMTVTTTSNNAKQLLLNPGAPEVWEHIIGGVMHVVRNYDVDGIHFDDYFYTNPATTTYNDDSVYTIHNRGIANRGDWRRSNVDTLIKRLNDSIKSVKPWVKFGISPSGIWASFNATTEPNGSSTSSGALQHKKDLFANSRLWLQQGWIDYLAPQIYWHTGQTGSDYSILAPWWSSNSFSRHIYIGQAGYKVGVASPTSNGLFITDVSQIPAQVRLNRSLSGIQGQIVYNTSSLRTNNLFFRDSLQQRFYNKPALLPTMPWKDSEVPDAPFNLLAQSLVNNTISLTWVNPTAANSTELNNVKRFAIYRNVNTNPDVNNIDHLLTITNTAVTSFIDAAVTANTTYKYVVTSLDRLQNESVESNVATATAGVVPLDLISFAVEKKASRQAKIHWQTANEINTDYFDIERAVNNNDFKKINTIAANSGSNGFNYNTYDYNLIENGTYYYRLKMVDKDGTYNYSEIRKLEVKNDGATIASFPNPVTKGEKMQLTWGKTNGNVNYKIFDINGKLVAENRAMFNNGLANIVLGNNIAAGVYILQFAKNNEQEVIRIVVR
jgi:uncharacterized lipoprotein YddW (UPF0748 family)